MNWRNILQIYFKINHCKWNNQRDFQEFDVNTIHELVSYLYKMLIIISLIWSSMFLYRYILFLTLTFSDNPVMYNMSSVCTRLCWWVFKYMSLKQWLLPSLDLMKTTISFIFQSDHCMSGLTCNRWGWLI